MNLYRLFFNAVFARMDPERAHGIGAFVIRQLGRPFVAPVVRRVCGPTPGLATTAFGIHFPSPFGLAAGFDKDGRYTDGLAALGFGHVEIGTVTPVAQPGNPKPRLFRLPADGALINRMGFNNAGADAVGEHLAAARRRGVVIGVNIGKNKLTPDDRAVDDYVAAAARLRRVADYFVVNVSSPNTPGLRGLQAVSALEPILHDTKRAAAGVPLLVKIAPDLPDGEIREIARLVRRLQLAGIVATNTTISRDADGTPLRTSRRVVEAYGAGGLSGAPVRERSLRVLRLLRDELPADVAVISVGGVRTADDVAERLAAGATLVQGYTAFLYEGPMWAAAINRGLTRKLGAARSLAGVSTSSPGRPSR